MGLYHDAIAAELVGPQDTTYAWEITKDHYDGSDVGVRGPSTATEAQLARLANGEGLPFKMKDDDGDLIYEGRIVFGDTEDPDPSPVRVEDRNGIKVPVVVAGVPEEGFGPLNDFGMPNFGCTEIWFKDSSTNRWGIL